MLPKEGHQGQGQTGGTFTPFSISLHSQSGRSTPECSNNIKIQPAKIVSLTDT